MQFEPLSEASLRGYERKHPKTSSANPPISSPSRACCTSLSGTSTRQISWLWPQRIPLGKLTLLESPPSLGLSLLALTIAASISSGSPLPSDTSAHANAPDPSPLDDPPVGADLSRPSPIDRPTAPAQGTVILISPHDNPTDTLKPRLQAAGANLDHIQLLNTVISPPTLNEASQQRPFCLPQDLELLEATIAEHHAVLVIIDPLSSALNLGRTRSQRPNISHILFSLAQIAERTSCAILITRHTTTSSPSPRPGSLDLASIRSILLLAPDPLDRRKRLLLTTSAPLCLPPPTLTYEIAATEHNTPTIHWLDERHHPPSLLLSGNPTTSALRQAIFSFLSRSSTPQAAKDVIKSIGYDYERVRKMLSRMARVGDLVSTSRGLYTTPGHPCLASENTASPPDGLSDDIDPVTQLITDLLQREAEGLVILSEEELNELRADLAESEQDEADDTSPETQLITPTDAVQVDNTSQEAPGYPGETDNTNQETIETQFTPSSTSNDGTTSEHNYPISPPLPVPNVPNVPNSANQNEL